MKPLRTFFIILVFGIGPVVTIHAEEVNIKAGEPGSLMNFGMAVATSGNTLIVGATSNQGSSGNVYIFEHRKNSWGQQARINAKDAAVKDWFGWAVAIDGNTAVVGAYEDGGQGQNQGGGIAKGPGFVYVFVRGAKEWTEQARLSAKDKAPVDRFGNSVSISGDRILVGAPFDDDAGENSGSTYLFERQGETWREKAKLTASDAAEGDQFGWDVGIDGDTAVIGAPLDDDAGSKSGAAYIFVRNADGTWAEQTKLTSSDLEAGDRLGTSVDISRLSNAYAIVGAPFDDDGDSKSGSAYVFVRNGNAWTEQDKLAATDAEAGDNFGISVAIDVNRALIGANLDDGDRFSNVGGAYAFLRVGSEVD